jgi:hypothetical protein
MGVLFNRDISVTVGDIKIASRPDTTDQPRPTLRITFNVSRSLSFDPNTASLAIYNLKKDNRSRLQESKKQRTSIAAGYVDNAHEIFNGDLEFVQSVNDGTDWITSLESGDGSQNRKKARINFSFKGPVSLGTVLEKLADATGFDLGNTIEKAREGNIRGALDEFKNGKVLTGNVMKKLEELAKTMGLGVSVQNGELQFVGPRETTRLPPVLLKAGTGMVGSPEAGDEGVVQVRSLLQPDLLPARKVRLESKEIEGDFRVEKVVFSGDTSATDWFSDCELKPL